MQIAILVLNLIASFTSATWAVVALIRPASLSGSVHIEPGEIFYARMYAARAVPLGLASGILPFCLGGPAIAWVLFIAAAAQIADVAIAVGKQERGMIMGASFATIVHIVCGLAIIVR
jgi:hypothetical protein